MEFVIVAVASLFVSGLTLYSGFGLGTLLMPVFALFFPLEVAVAGTAVVHGANNLFKVAVVGQHTSRLVVIRFGLPAIMAAFVGAATLGYMADFGEIGRYAVGGRIAVITPIKLIIAILMLGFAVVELLPRLRGLRFDTRYLVVGGLLSGFFGGLSGHQGALRSAFLVKTGISTETFVGTNATIGLMVDVARLMIYAILFVGSGAATPIESGQWPLIATGVVSAFAGVVVGKRYLEGVTMVTVQKLTGVLLFGIALALGSGIL